MTPHPPPLVLVAVVRACCCCDQTSTLLAGLFRGGGGSLALVVAPLSCLAAWERELERTFQLQEEEVQVEVEVEDRRARVKPAATTGWIARGQSGGAATRGGRKVRVVALSSDKSPAQRARVLRELGDAAALRRLRQSRQKQGGGGASSWDGGEGCAVVLAT